jgi:hypothetical protein
VAGVGAGCALHPSYPLPSDPCSQAEPKEWTRAKFRPTCISTMLSRELELFGTRGAKRALRVPGPSDG